MLRNKSKRPPREGFRRRVNPYYGNMSRREIIADTAKTALRWFVFTVFAYIYWLVMLLLFSIFLLNVWRVTLVQILLYSLILCIISSVVYACVLVHRKFYY